MYSDSTTSCPFCSALHKNTRTVDFYACYDGHRFVIKNFFWNKIRCTDPTIHTHCKCKVCGGKWKVLVNIQE